METKIIKDFPIFWTFIKKDGITTIHQVKFKALYVEAYTTTNGNGRVTTIEKAIFNIAGRPELFIGGQNERSFGQGISDHKDSLKKYFTLDCVYATKEEAEKAARSNRYPHNHFHHIGGEKYTITKYSPLFELGDFSWENNVPHNMKLKTNENGSTYLCGWRSDGLDVNYYRVYGNDKVQVIEGEVVHNVSDFMIFDMVSREWVNKPKYDYYKTKEECENASSQEVFVFED